MVLITDRYRALQARMHTKKRRYGESGRKWAPEVARWVEATGSGTVIDYGCGKETLAKALPALRITGYDPAIPGRDRSPIPHDFLACTDVLEHIEPECIDEVLDDMQRLATKGVFMVISLVPSNKVLPDRRKTNAHILIRPPMWWLHKIKARWIVGHWTVNERHITVFALAYHTGGTFTPHPSKYRGRH